MKMAVLMPSCAKSVPSHADSAWGVGRWGIPLGRGGGGGGVGEPRTGIINPPWGCRVQGCRV